MKRSSLVILLLGLGVLLFFAARLMLFIKYYEFFSELNSVQILTAFLDGIRFDCAVFFLVAAPICLMLFIPITNVFWRKIWMWLLFVFYMVSAVLLTIDCFYFGYMGRHFADELYYLGAEGAFIGGVAKEYAPAVFFLFIFVFISGFFYRKLTNLSLKTERLRLPKVFLFMALSFIAIRGTFAEKPLSTIDAYKGGITRGHLVMNGVYSTYRYGKRVQHSLLLPKGEAERVLGLDGTKEYPLLASFPEQDKKLNIVIIILESWSAYYIKTLNPEAPGVTPYFDNLTKEGAFFVNHYTPFNRSIHSIQAILTGIPPVKGLPTIGFGLEIKSSGNLGNTALKNGYDTIFVQSSTRRSMYIDSVAGALGFKKYFGWEDYPLLLDYPDPKAPYYGWDYDAVSFFMKQINVSEEPFFGVYFSGTSHMPFAPLPERFMRPGAASNNEEGFLSTLAYSDWALESFMEEAKKQDWYKDTIFIITADHALNEFEEFSSFSEKFAIPLLVYSPYRIEAARYEKTTSHLDILPTVFTLTGMGGEAALVGQDLFADSEGAAIINEGEVMSYITDRGWVRTTGDKVLERGGENPDELADKIMAWQDIIFTYIDKGRWAPR